MKKISLILALLSLGTIVYSVTVGFEPPAEYMEALKTCTPGQFQKSNAGDLTKYNIKGKNDGRCEVEISSSFHHNDETYELMKSMVKTFAGNKIKDSDIPSKEIMNMQLKNEVTKHVCKFNDNEVNNLYNAYLKHDSKNSYQKQATGGFSASFSLSNMSSYDKLMMQYQQGPCVSSDEVVLNRYYCEYADTACYVKFCNNTAIQCNPNKKGFNYAVVEEHAQSGMCQKL